MGADMKYVYIHKQKNPRNYANDLRFGVLYFDVLLDDLTHTIRVAVSAKQYINWI